MNENVKNKRMCQCCEEQEATRKVMLTDIDGILLDEVILCGDCVVGTTVHRDGQNLTY